MFLKRRHQHPFYTQRLRADRGLPAIPRGGVVLRIQPRAPPEKTFGRAQTGCKRCLVAGAPQESSVEVSPGSSPRAAIPRPVPTGCGGDAQGAVSMTDRSSKGRGRVRARASALPATPHGRRPTGMRPRRGGARAITEPALAWPFATEHRAPSGEDTTPTASFPRSIAQSRSLDHLDNADHLDHPITSARDVDHGEVPLMRGNVRRAARRVKRRRRAGARLTGTRGPRVVRVRSRDRVGYPPHVPPAAVG